MPEIKRRPLNKQALGIDGTGPDDVWAYAGDTVDQGNIINPSLFHYSCA